MISDSIIEMMYKIVNGKTKRVDDTETRVSEREREIETEKKRLPKL